jgi:hypothetical protein
MVDRRLPALRPAQAAGSGRDDVHRVPPRKQGARTRRLETRTSPRAPRVFTMASIAAGGPACRAKQVARSVERGSRRDAKGRVRRDHAKQLVCISPAMEAFTDEQPSLVLLVRSDASGPGSRSRRAKQNRDDPRGTPRLPSGRQRWADAGRAPSGAPGLAQERRWRAGCSSPPGGSRSVALRFDFY